MIWFTLYPHYPTNTTTNQSYANTEVTYDVMITSMVMIYYNRKDLPQDVQFIKFPSLQRLHVPPHLATRHNLNTPLSSVSLFCFLQLQDILAQFLKATTEKATWASQEEELACTRFTLIP